VYFTAKGKHPVPGRFADVKVTGCVDCDLTGEALE
jgi:hypothetical protein